MAEPRSWTDITTVDPTHSTRYVERFRALAAAGEDLAGEARLVDAMAPPGAHILDAGSGTGRVGSVLSTHGHHVVGVDADPVLVAAARLDHPGSTWLLGDLAALDLVAEGIPDPFDVIVCAGNVVTFVAVDDRRTVLGRLRDHLAGDGRIVVGFGAGRGYPFDEFRDDCTREGLVAHLELATWDLRPFTGGDFLVSVLGRS